MAAQRRIRLDQLLVDRGLAPSRARAQSLILAGAVRLDGAPITKAGTAVPEDASVDVREDPNPFVSRGGLKLVAALDAFGIVATGRVALDIGASTGGFTDVLLRRGAARVYAVDVGYGQLAWELRQDSRVVVKERTNARHLTTDDVPEPCAVCVVDVSFISTAKVMPALLPLLSADADVVVLVKPQFEAEPDEVGKGGVIRKAPLRQMIIDRAVGRLIETGLREAGRIDSPVPGPKGNVECLVWFRRT